MGTLWLWILFNAAVLLMLATDLGVFNRRAHRFSLREAAAWSVVWVALSLAFNLWIYLAHGHTPALEFFTGYVVEKSLSVDNIFVFVLLFQYFGVEPRHQHRVLFWGVLGALVLRGAMIGLGVALIHKFAWILYVFGAFLIYAGAKMMFFKKEEVHPERNPAFRWARKFLPVTKTYEGQKLFVRREGAWMATPLLLVLLVVETTDIVFAVDSIPAIFGITQDPFIVYTSNICAILGLRAFYFLLAGILPYFRYLSAGLSLVLAFIGVKMLAQPWVHVPTHIALGVVGVILGTAAAASLVKVRSERRADGKEAPSTNQGRSAPTQAGENYEQQVPSGAPDSGAAIRGLESNDAKNREKAAAQLYETGLELIRTALKRWRQDSEFAALLAGADRPRNPETGNSEVVALTVGVAVTPESFEKIRAANGSPRLADVPPDQDAKEFELHFSAPVRLDILTTRAPEGGGAIARFLKRFGEGIQQVEIQTTNAARATQIIETRFHETPVYPAVRPGADGTRVNFFLIAGADGKKVLVELVENP